MDRGIPYGTGGRRGYDPDLGLRDQDRDCFPVHQKSSSNNQRFRVDSKNIHLTQIIRVVEYLPTLVFTLTRPLPSSLPPNNPVGDG